LDNGWLKHEPKSNCSNCIRLFKELDNGWLK
jgi:hypothetical protein